LYTRAIGRTLGAAWVAVAATLGCRGDIGKPQGSNANGPPGVGPVTGIGVDRTDPCLTAEQSFGWEVYGPVFSRCIGCHNDFGLARNVGVAYRLIFPGEPEFAERNVQTLTAYATRTVETPSGTLPLLVAKPTARIAHVGGEVLAPDSAEAALLASFVAKLASGATCNQVPGDQAANALASVQLAAPRTTFARAKFVLTGDLATPEELDPLADTESMLDAKLDELMGTEKFLGRVQEMFADWLNTDAYTSLVRGDDLLQQLGDYPRRTYFLPLCTPTVTNNCCNSAMQTCCASVNADPAACTPAINDLAIDAVAREPLELVKHIVRNNLPVTELVTANYGLVNPYSAIIYGLTDADRAQLFDADPKNDATEWKPFQVGPTPFNALRAGPSGGYPHTGILSTPSLLVRYPSSTSNVERTRGARVVLERMLAIPVTKLADFSTAKLPPDADLELATQQYAACTACHAAIDPIAGHFRNYGTSGQYRPGSKMPTHLPAAAFLGQSMPMGDTGDPLQFLGTLVAQHPRFALGVLMPVMADLIGAPILTPPPDVTADGYAAKYMAFRLQQIEIQRLRREFVGPAGLRIKPLVKAIVKGPFFRAVGAPPFDPVMTQAFGLAGIGQGTLLTPEQLHRKIASATGISYKSDPSATGRDMLLSFRDYRLMFGGTDWDSTADRYREPNAMATRIAMRMGNEMACVAVPQDFAIKDVAARKLFPNVTPATRPEAGGEAQIRVEIRRLHRLMLNEDLAEGSAEIEATYQLWSQSHQALLAAGQTATAIRLPTRCRAMAAYAPGGAPYPDATHDALQDDPNATVRAWMAVVAYLLSDGRFFLQ
jgi:hypothetical protein